MRPVTLKKSKLEQVTAELYGSIFNDIGPADFIQRSEAYLDRIFQDRKWFKGKTCLDAGCGNGIASYGISSAGMSKVFAFDISDKCLKICQRMMGNRNNLYLIRASAEVVPFKSNSFDFVNCNGVIHHLTDVDSALSELFRVLKPRGLIFIGVYGSGGLLNEFKIKFYRFFTKYVPYALLKRILWCREKSEWLDNLCVPIRRSFTENKMKRLLAKNGYSCIKRVEASFYKRPGNLWKKIVLGKDGMYMHFLATK